MLSYKRFIITFLALFSSISSITASREIKKPLQSSKIVVDPSDQGGFKTIQDAIDSVPSDNKKWVTIDIKRGIYREKVLIPNDKPFIYLKGEGKENTIIVWNEHGAINQIATFTSEADNIIARDITFTNSYNSPPQSNRNPVGAAVAALIGGDKSAFYRCGFYGLQDTLWDHQGRHYYKDSTIEGAIDFIFGHGQTLFERCSISVAAGGLGSTEGFITAQGREHPNDVNGFVFKDCNIDGDGKAYLGRAWRDYARVLFHSTNMSNVIVPQGWDAWNTKGQEELLTMSEYNCGGEGANSAERVKWAKKLSAEEANNLASFSFIDEEQGWINQALTLMSS